MERAAPITFPEDETFDVGLGTRTGVSELSFEFEPVLPEPSARAEGGG